MIPSCVFYLLISSFQICMMDRANIAFFCGFLETVASCLVKYHVGRHKSRADAFTALLTLALNAFGQLLGRPCLGCFPLMVRTVELSDDFSPQDCAI
jgi:hypothetical protein